MTKEEIKIGTQFVYKGHSYPDEKNVIQTIIDIDGDEVYSDRFCNEFIIGHQYANDCEVVGFYDRKLIYDELITNLSTTTDHTMSNYLDIIQKSIQAIKDNSLDKLEMLFVLNRMYNHFKERNQVISSIFHALRDDYINELEKM